MIAYAGNTMILDWGRNGLTDAPALGVASRLQLEALLPNPTSGNLQLRFSLPGDEVARLEVFDATGRLRLARELRGLGRGPHVWTMERAEPWAAGVYVVRLTQRSEKASAKAVVLR